MNKQYDLFGYPLYDGEPPSQKHSDTSRAAASQIKHKIGPLHHQIMDYLERNPQGATDERMQSDIPMAANTQRPRRVELTQLGRVIDAGRRDVTRARRAAVVWTLRENKR